MKKSNTANTNKKITKVKTKSHRYWKLAYFHRKTWRELQCDKVLQLSEVRICGRHQVDDRNELFRQRKRILLAEPKLSTELLCLCRLLDGPANVAARQVEFYVEVLFGSYACRIVWYDCKFLQVFSPNLTKIFEIKSFEIIQIHSHFVHSSKPSKTNRTMLWSTVSENRNFLKPKL